ncbi:NAD(P)-dependent alcohol dehydrogenase [Sphingobium indicum]|uniref:NAD(P)-dependent alcohol dehydrogenase n=1 Tax=Sphingobium indicum TaxID=332055 RepID=A0A4Q4J5P1_9SPHN|nr:NAD(P)-dependent alcohol dehydrogenase [Sphingobium indicum]NYI23640.1 aryl-alcohol dehydrogenase [Sphingobium indicum]RYM01513.1 NAD(P)-dependent alcohol dehydrogenase [Sphingobium indicum]
MTEATAAVLRSPGGDFTLERIEVAAPRPGEVRVRVLGVGLCHTDLIFRDQRAPFALPGVLGHEGAGVIESVGEGVEGLAVGDQVVIGFSSCGACPRCEEHLPSYCQGFVPLNYAGRRLDDGSTAYAKDGERITSHFFGQSSFSSLTVTRARNVVKVDGSKVALELLGPLGCGFQTGAGGVMNALACPAGSSIAVFGGGPVGLAAVMGAAIRGCSTIILVEPIAARREIARELGATHAIDPAEAGDLADALRAIVPAGLDFAFDTSGVVPVIEAGLAALGSHGAIGLVGVPARADAALNVRIAGLMTPGHRIIGIIEGDSDPQVFIPELIAHHGAGRFPFDKLIKTFPLAEINEAIAAQSRGECIKVVLIP